MFKLPLVSKTAAMHPQKHLLLRNRIQYSTLNSTGRIPKTNFNFCSVSASNGPISSSFQSPGTQNRNYTHPLTRNYSSWLMHTHPQHPKCIHLEMNSNKVNAFSLDFFNTFLSLMDEIDAVHDNERPVVLRSKHRVFSAGLDLKYLYELQQMYQNDPMEAKRLAREYVALFNKTLERFYLWNRPTVAFIDGPVIAGGLPLALAADFRILDKKANTSPIKLHAVNLGLSFPSSVNFILQQGLPKQIAQETMLLGKEFSSTDLTSANIMKSGYLEDCDKLFSNVDPKAYMSVKKGVKEHKWKAFQKEQGRDLDREFVELLFSQGSMERIPKALIRPSSKSSIQGE